MLRRASVWDIKNNRIDRAQAHLVVAMRFYPRFVKRELVDEYWRELAPPAELFVEFKATVRKIKNHNNAFHLVDYENRFDLSEAGKTRLKDLAELSTHKNIALICQCRDFERCHCDLLLLWAKQKYNAVIREPLLTYPNFIARLEHPLTRTCNM